jgi:hypothetical protein
VNVTNLTADWIFNKIRIRLQLWQIMNEILKIKYGLEENKWRKLVSLFIDILYQEILGHTQARWESTKLLIASVLFSRHLSSRLKIF